MRPATVAQSLAPSDRVADDRKRRVDLGRGRRRRSPAGNPVPYRGRQAMCPRRRDLGLALPYRFRTDRGVQIGDLKRVLPVQVYAGRLE